MNNVIHKTELINATIEEEYNFMVKKEILIPKSPIAEPPEVTRVIVPFFILNP